MTSRASGAAIPSRGPVVVITGASSGIGRATARRYAAQSARLVLASRSRPALDEVAAECRSAGAQAIVVPTDVADEAAVHALAEAAVREFGRIDVWVGGAGVFAYGLFEELPSELFRRVVETNLMGQVHGARAVLPHFRRQGSGALVMIASLYSKIGSPYVSPYVTSKFGVLGFGDVLRQEVRGERGIRIRVVLPATIDTPIYQHAANLTGRRVHPLPPIASPERVGRAVVKAPHRRRFATHVGQTLRAAVIVQRIAPRLYDAIKAVLMNVIELRGRGERLTDGTVFTAPTAAGEVTGRWRSAPFRALVIAAAGVVGAGAVRALQRKPSA